MKKIILMIAVTILAANVATAQHTRGIKKETQSHAVVVTPVQQQVVSDQKANANRQLNQAQNEVQNAQNAVNEAQRKLNELLARHKKAAEKFAGKQAKITDPAKREAEQKKFDQKMTKEQMKAQEAYGRALARLYRAQENLDRALSEKGM